MYLLVTAHINEHIWNMISQHETNLQEAVANGWKVCVYTFNNQILLYMFVDR